MISFAKIKKDPNTFPACKDCVRRNSPGIKSCDEFCAVNEEIAYQCPFCSREGTHIGVRTAGRFHCGFCARSLAILDTMGYNLNGKEKRIKYHRGQADYAQDDNK